MKPKFIVTLFVGIIIVVALFTSRQVFSKVKLTEVPSTHANGSSAAISGATPTPMPTATPISKVLVTNRCASSTVSSGAYTVNLCFTAPNSGIIVSKVISVTASVKVTGKNPGISQVQFFINGDQLITDFENPWTFQLPTTKWQDGSYVISAAAEMRDGYISANQASILLTYKNGIMQQPANPGKFTPTSGTTPKKGAPFIIAAAGDGADGAKNNLNVSNEIATINPNLFLYLGDVYESGTLAEFYNWYGSGSTSFSRFFSITDPTIGNHEYLSSSGAGYFDYWNNIPNYYSFNAGGWHFISLNSNAAHIEVSANSNQYKWLQQDLAANSSLCTIVYYHQPFFNIGPEGSAKSLSDIWALLAKSGVTIVLNGHDHDYQRWVPLDGNGNPAPNGITEFVAGGGGHGLQKFTNTDPRVAFSDDLNPQTFGVLELALSAKTASFKYINSSGKTLDSGIVACNK